jgi:YbgC/YbaW family acyl-CoA thioester hydrolase
MRRSRCAGLFPYEKDFNMTPEDFRFSHTLRVRWVEVDMQKIVFNGHYLMYFDTAITDYWRTLGLPYEEAMQQLGGDLYVKKASVEYHGSARFDDRLEVALQCARIGNSSLTFSGAIFRDGALLVSCELIYVFADPVAQTSKPVPQALRELLDKFEAGGDMIRVETGDWATLGADATALRTAVFGFLGSDANFAQPKAGLEGSVRCTEANLDSDPNNPIALNLMSDAADEAGFHAVAYNGLGQAVATGRLVRRDDAVGQIGRLAVHRALRGSGVGTQVLQALVIGAKQRGDLEVMLHAQRSAQGFYGRTGFTARGAYFEEAGLPHLEFFKRL